MPLQLEFQTVYQKVWCNGEFRALSGHSRKIPFADTAFSLLTGIASISSRILYGPRISTLILFYVYRSSWVVDLEAINHLKATIVKLLLYIKIRLSYALVMMKRKEILHSLLQFCNFHYNALSICCVYGQCHVWVCRWCDFALSRLATLLLHMVLKIKNHKTQGSFFFSLDHR